MTCVNSAAVLLLRNYSQRYTLDGVPLGDQQYGNYNGLSPQRAIVSEDVGLVTLASGAGDLGTASTSNLGGTDDPEVDRAAVGPGDRRASSEIFAEPVRMAEDARRAQSMLSDSGSFVCRPGYDIVMESFFRSDPQLLRDSIQRSLESLSDMDKFPSPAHRDTGLGKFDAQLRWTEHGGSEIAM
jgi:hypothetical protein